MLLATPEESETKSPLRFDVLECMHRFLHRSRCVTVYWTSARDVRT